MQRLVGLGPWTTPAGSRQVCLLVRALLLVFVLALDLLDQSETSEKQI